MQEVISDEVSRIPREIVLPRANGELVFDSPWEARAFGLVVALHEKGAFDWRLFSCMLSEEIAAAEGNGEKSTYYEHWLGALSRITLDKALLVSEEVISRAHKIRDQDGHEHH